MALVVFASSLLSGCSILGAKIDDRFDLTHAEFLDQTKSREDIYEKYLYVYSDTTYSLPEGTNVNVVVVQVSPNMIEEFTRQSGEIPFKNFDPAVPEISAFAEFWLVDNTVVFWRTNGRSFQYRTVKWQSRGMLFDTLVFIDLIGILWMSLL